MAFKNPNVRSLLNKDEEDEKKKRNYFVLPTFEELQAIEQEAKEDAAKVASSERGLEFFKTPDVWDPDASTGEKIANAGKIALGTLGDVGVGTVKGVMKMGEGIGDALQYGAAAVTDLFGADETAERIRKNAQREAVADAFRGVDEKLDRYSVLGRTADAGTEALGQIGGILAMGGIAGALGAGAAGTTAVTTGVMGASSFGSGTSEAYAAGAEEGEAEAYGAIAGAADALSEMIFGGLGKGIHALGVSKGLSSADDMLAKALSSKIRNTLAKNTVQLGVKAGAEGLEEVLAGTMQAAGKKMTYMSERDFLDILEDENLLEQFVVGALASGIAQTPGYVSASRAGVDLVSDGGTEDAGGAENTRASTNLRIAEIERTGRAAGADEGVMALARDVSSLTGRGVRFFSEAENDGYINNGFWDPDSNTININVKSKNPSAQILSHELTHSIENTDSYLQLRSVIFDRMKRDGMDIDAEYRKKEMLYNDAGYRLRDEGEIAHEIIAEQIEKRYLTDEASIRSLVSENRTLGQRIREWFDSLLAKMGNAEAKERDYVRQVRDLYARALGENVQGAQQNAEVKHSITGINDAGIEVYETSPETKALTWNERKARYLDIMKNEYQGRTAKFTRNGHVYYAKYDPNSLRKPIYGDNRSSPNGVKAVIKSGADGDLFNLVENSQYTGSQKNTKNHTSADYFDYFVKTVQIDGKVFDLMADVEKNYGVDGGYVYTLALVDNKKIKASPAHGTPTVPVNNAGNASGNSIPQDGGNVNREFSVSEVAQDSEGRQLSDGQREYFRDSKVTDANGNLKVMYHGTAGEGFTVFDKRKAKTSGTFGNGFYFSDSKSHAGQYGKTYEVYLNITNPLSGGTKTITEDQMRDFVEAVAENEDYGIENYGYGSTVDSVARSLSSKTDFEALMDVNLTCIGNMAEALQLFGEVTGRKYDGIITPMETVVFDPEQIKNVDNLNPTSNPDIRYSVSKSDDPDSKRVMQNADGGYEMANPGRLNNPRMTNGKSNGKETFTRAEAVGNRDKRSRKRENRKTIARAETAFRRLGFDIEGAIVENYEDAAGIIEDNKLAAWAADDIAKYIEANNISPRIDNAAKLIAQGEAKSDELGMKQEDQALAEELATIYEQSREFNRNNIRAQGVKTTDAVNNRLDTIFSGYEWFSDKGKKAKRLGSQLQLNLSSPEQVIRDVFGDGAVSKELNEYLIRPTIENSARARRQTNQMIAGLRKFGLNKSESAVTQIFSEYSNLEESGSKKHALTREKLRSVLRGEIETEKAASDIADTEYDGDTPERKEFQDSLKDVLDTAIKVNRTRANQRALREFKESGGTNTGWSTLSKEERQKKIDAAFAAVTDESIGRITEATKELRHLLDDMYDAINAISVIHGAQPIKFRRGYMPHSHKQTEELQKWFNDHMGGINVTPVGDLPTDIAGKTADRKPNKRWFSHAQERTGPRTTWDALGNVEDYLRVANDTIYHIDDIRKMRVLERYIRGIYSVARGATGEEQRSRVRNDVMQRLHGELDDDELVFLGLKKREQPKISDEDMDLSQMTPFVTWLTNYANDLAAKQIFNRDIEAVAGRKYNNLANTITSWSSRVMMQYNISSNLKQLSQLGTVSGDVGIRISKDAAEMTLKSMRNLGNGSNDLEQKYHISERSTFLAEKQAVEEATFASDKDLTEKQKTERQHVKDIWDNAWSFTDMAMSRYAVYSYFMEGMARGMDDTAALRYADTKARNILASRMKGASPLIFQSKNPILRMFTLFQREPLAAWQDVLKTMPREYAEMKNIKGEQEAKTWMAKRVTGRVLGASMVNTFYAAVLGLGTPAMFDLLGDPLRRILEKVMRELTPDEEDDITWEETGKRFLAGIKDEVVDDVPFANLLGLIANTYTGSEFETRLALNVPDIGKIFGLFGLGKDAVDLAAKIAQEDDPEKIEALQEQLASVPGQIPITLLNMLTEIVGTAAPAGNQIRKSAEGLIAVLRAGEYTDDGRLKYEVGGLDIIPALLYGKSGTRAAQEWVKDDFDTLSKAESEAYRDLIEIGVSPAKAARYVQIVSAAEKIDTTETQAQAEGRIIDGMDELDAEQKAELYYDMVATDTQREAVDLAVKAGATMTDAVETARAIRDASKRLDKITALIASDMETDAREAMYLAMVATKTKDADGNVTGTEDDERLEAMYATGLDFDDFLDAKQMQSSLNADESLSGNGRATRFLAWVSKNGYTDTQADVIGEQFPFSSGFRVSPTTYQKMVDGGVEPDNAVTFSDALSGTERAIDKINAMWGTGIGGKQLDAAIKAVVSEKQYENYHIIIDANVPLDAYTWVLDNADIDGNGSISNEEREVTLSRLALDPSDLSALWLATGGSEKSNPYKGSAFGIKMPEINIPQIDMPELDFNIPHFDFEFNFGGNKT